MFRRAGVENGRHFEGARGRFRGSLARSKFVPRCYIIAYQDGPRLICNDIKSGYIIAYQKGPKTRNGESKCWRAPRRAARAAGGPTLRSLTQNRPTQSGAPARAGAPGGGLTLSRSNPYATNPKVPPGAPDGNPVGFDPKPRPTRS